MRMTPANQNCALVAAAGGVTYSPAEIGVITAAVVATCVAGIIHCWSQGQAVSVDWLVNDWAPDVDQARIRYHFPKSLNAAKFIAQMSGLKIPSPCFVPLSPKPRIGEELA